MNFPLLLKRFQLQASLLVLLICSSSHTIFGQEVIHQLSVNEGLSHSDVTCLAQDKSGFIWMGSNNGLNRYNGYDFKIFKNDLNDENSLVNSRIKSVFCDSINRIWIATETNAISYLNQRSRLFHKIPVNDDSFQLATQFTQDEEGVIWFSGDNKKLYRTRESNDGLKVAKESITFPSGILEIKAYNSYIWVCTNSDGLWRVDTKTQQAERLSTAPFRNPYSLTMTEEALLVVTSNGIFSINKNLEIEHIFKSQLGFVSNFVVDFENNIWVALHNKGVLLLEQDISGLYQITSHFGTGNFLNTNRINELMIDSFDVLWIGTSGGGAYYIDLRAKPFITIDRSTSNIPDNYITAFYENKTHYWIGTRNGLLEYDKRDQSSFVKTEDHISNIYEDYKGELWVSKRMNGLWHFKGDQLIQVYDKSSTAQFGSSEIMGVEGDSYGRLWVLTNDDGIYILDINTGEVLQHLNTENVLPTNNFNFIYADPQLKHTMWLATRSKGLVKLTLEDSSKYAVQTYSFDPDDSNSIGSDYIWPILRSKKGVLWVGTIGGGLNELVESTAGNYFKRYTAQDGLPDNDVESILEDGTGDLWIGGKGLTKFNPEIEHFIAFDFRDGLQSNSFKIGAAYKNEQGILYFGGINGLTYFNPRLIVPNPYKPKLVLEDLKILNKSVKVGERINSRVLLEKSLNYTNKLEFKSKENEFTLELLGLHYSNPEKNKYAYLLDGYMDEWVELSASERKITFANLPAGDYILKAKTANSDGVWSDVRDLKIHILPPWWASWWAYVIYISLILGALYMYTLFVKRQSKLKNDLIIAEKEMNLNEEKIQFFTSMSHEIRTPLTLISNPLDDIIEKEAEQKRYLDKLILIRKNVNRLLNLSNQLLDFRKMESGNTKLNVAEGNISNFSKEIYSFFLNLAEERNIEYTYNSIPDAIKLTFDRHNFEIILTNLISNAFKYTPANGKISVKLKAVGKDSLPAVFKKYKGYTKLQENYLELCVEDNGIGMSPEVVKCIFDRYYQVKNVNTLSIHGTGIGLSLVKGLVKLHSGEIYVESTEGKGSKFVLYIPFGQQHFEESELLKDFKKSDHKSFYSDHFPSYLDKNQQVNTASSEFKKRVLVVEDNKEIQNYISEHLSPDYNVLLASNGKKGYDKAKEFIPDIIISDVMMPKMDGLEMLRLLKKDPDLSFIPVILLTARTATLYELEGIEIGAQDYITKPFNINILKGKITNILISRENFKRYYSSHIKNETPLINLPNAEQKFLDDLTNLVIENLLNEDFSVKILVSEMGMSQSSCYKRIKELTDRSVVQFIRDVRLKRAGELLKTYDYNISEVAFMVGISDLKYFREKFKEHYGCTPSDYLKTEE